MTIRAFREADQDAVIDLWRRCELLVPWNDPRRDIARKLAVGRQYFLVAEDEGRIVGTVMGGYDGHRGWINYLAVCPDQRRAGWGTRLMDEVTALLLHDGCPKINLQVRETNTTVLAFYHALGYRQDAVLSLGRRLISDD